MRGTTKRIAGWFAPGHAEPGNVDARSRIGLLEGWTSVIVNTAFGALKAALGWMTGSVALLADAAHTFADTGTSAVVIFGFRSARKPADSRHPYGHGRVESIASVAIAALLAATAFETGKAAVMRILTPHPVDAGWWVVGIVAMMLAGKEALARFSMHLGDLIDSDALRADAWHHRSDVFATGMVIASFIAGRFGAGWVDGAAGLAVATLIGWAAFDIMKRASGPLIGEHAPDKMYAEAARIAGAVDGVKGVHDIRIERYGTENVISLHVVVAGEISARAAHDITVEVESRIAGRFGGYATAHPDPAGSSHPKRGAVRKALQSVLPRIPKCPSYHDLRMEEQDGLLTVRLDLATSEKLSSDESAAYEELIRKQVADELPGARVEVAFDPPYCRDGAAK